ncbi:MAG: hypothetical protein BECKG1743D_GA0114223_104481, partial [Candidatus Kentron sp. G]
MSVPSSLEDEGGVRAPFLLGGEEKYPLNSNKAISIKEYTNLLVFIVQLLRCNNSYIVHDAPAARLVLRPSKFEGHCPMIRHGCRMALMVALNWS